LFTTWFIIERSDQFKNSIIIQLSKVLKVVIPIVAIASFVLTILVGHSGAEATWKDRIAQTQATDLQDSASNTKPEPKAGNSVGSRVLSNAEIKSHNKKSDCWSIVNGNVYNLTSFVQKHPGGAAVIANICGKDGTNAFTNQHSTQTKPNNILSSFLLGPIGGTISSEVGQKVIAPPASGVGNDSSGESEND